MINHDTDIVAEILHQIADQLGEEAFSCWFCEKVKISVHESTLYVDSSMPYITRWNRQTYKNLLLEILSSIAPGIKKVEFRTVQEALFPNQPYTPGKVSRGKKEQSPAEKRASRVKKADLVEV